MGASYFTTHDGWAEDWRTAVDHAHRYAVRHQRRYGVRWRGGPRAWVVTPLDRP